MSYTIEKQTGDVVISGFYDGIADSPYDGIADMRNVNIIPIPHEASVNFSTSKISSPNASGTVVSASAADDTVTLNDNLLESGAWVVFSGGALPAGIVAGTAYKLVRTTGNTYSVYTNYAGTSFLNITSDGTGTYTTINMGAPKYFAYDTGNATYWMVDATGYVWSNAVTTTGTTQYWTYTGNKINNNSNGNGLVFYRASSGTGYIFVFSNSSIDYSPSASADVAWTYQWDASAGTAGGYNASPTQKLKTATTVNNSHESLVAPDNKVYYCDANYIGRWYQSSPDTAFDPANKATYTYDQTAVLPFNDVANCLAPLGNTLLVGGSKNVIYPWDTFSQLPSYPILVSEYNIQKMVTVNTNTFALVGNRGRVYVTNGSQAQLYKKIPDHLSGTVEPYYTWGGLTSNKNQLYFGATATTNAGVAINQYGGVWGIDLDTKAIRLTNKLSYDTYAGYATAIIPNFAANAGGTGLFIGWNSGASTYGIDTTISNPYTGGQSIIASDLVPLGTFLQPTTSNRVEFKLSVPLATGESIKLQYRQAFSDSFTDVSSTTTFTGATANTYSGVYQNVPFQNSQWIQIQAVLTSTANSPSYVRLTEIRLGN